MSPKDRHIAVLTGDLVQSARLSPSRMETAFTALEQVVADIGTWQNARPHISRSRGDGWQLTLDTPEQAVRAALLVRAAMCAEDSAITTRIAIATGPSDTEIPHDLNEATGPVFIASGRALDSMPNGTLMIHANGGPIAAATRLADHISQGWTGAQAAAIRLALSPARPTQADIGAALGKSRQAVSQALVAAGYPALSDALSYIETAHG